LKRIQRFALCLILLLTSATLFGAPTKFRTVDDNDVVVKPGNIHPLARPEFDRGPTERGLRFDKMILVVPPRADRQAALAAFVAGQHDPLSPDYHHWLSADEYGRRFGITDADLEAITSWLGRSGFSVDEVAPGRGWVNFSGVVRDVERVFRTHIDDYVVDGRLYHANANSPSVPRGLADLVSGIVSLHNFPRQPMNHGLRKVIAVPDESGSERYVDPSFNSSTGAHFLAPADFATIYNVNALYSAGINGAGQSIAIVGRTDIALADVQFFRSNFGLVANDPIFVHNGVDPGNLHGGDEGEADLDVEWSGAVAPNATIRFVISKSTATTDGVDLSAQFIVTNNTAPIMSTSFGQCESQMGATENAFYNNIWSQAATEGITSFVSSGDSGAAGCNGGSDPTGSGAAISGLASTPFNVAVGGTQFADTANPAAFWAAANNATTKGSALSYIPEVAWNESGNVTGGSGLWSSAGGKSTIYAKPAFQTGTGVPADGVRDIPDVSLSAAGHDGYLVITGHTATVSGLGAVGGTSASSPSFAGLMALVVQKTAQRWGNANTRFYALANAQRAGTGPVIFHDITSGNNSVPGVAGFSCGAGYDLVTGLGTVDAASLVNNFNGAATPDFTVAASPTALTVVQGGSGSSTLSTTVSGGFNSAVTLSASGVPVGTTATFSPASIAAPGAGSSTLTFTVGASTAAGSYPITVTASGGAKTHTATVTLTVSATAVADFSIATAPASVSVAVGSSGSSLVSTAISGGFNAAVALSSSGAPAGVTVTFAPASIAAPGSGSSTATLAAASTTVPGTYTITVTGTGGTRTHSATITLTVTGGAAQQLIGNPGFENGSAAPAPWTATAGVIDSSTGEAAHAGAWKAWLDGYGTTHTDSILQTVTIPASVTTANLTFWLHIDSAETTTTTAFDTLKVQVRSTAGTVLSTLATFSNLNKATGFAQKSFSLAAFKGQTVQIFLVGTEDTSLQTSFVVDDFALNVQ
jgi:pseudomonalisin